MKLVIILQHRGAIEALKQALPANGATALRIRRAIKPLVEALGDYNGLVEAKLKELGKTQIRGSDPEAPAVEAFLNSAAQEEVCGDVEPILTEADLETLRVPRRDNAITGLTVAEIDSIEALGLIKKL